MDPSDPLAPAPPEPPKPVVPPLRLREPLPAAVDTAAGLAAVLEAISAGQGPVALRRRARVWLPVLLACLPGATASAGSGTALVDPIAFADLSELNEAIGTPMDPACRDSGPAVPEAIGMDPRSLFDTELAGRLLNLPRVGLASLVDSLLGFSLAKSTLRSTGRPAAAHFRGSSTPHSMSRRCWSCARR
jgi:ribonuclease D